MKTFHRILLACVAVVAIAAAPAHAKLNVVATLPDLASIAREIGGDHIKVTSLALGTEDPHFVDAKPSFIRVLNQADVLIEGGAELETGWLPPLVNNARNAKILGNAPGHILASTGLRLLELPTGPVDRSQGDVHPLGNPHYLLDPANARMVAATLAQTFSQLDASHAADYQASLKKFEDRLAAKIAEWDKTMAPFRGARIVTYHKSWAYFANHFGIDVVATLEPKPGIEPSPTHIAALIPQAKAAGVKLILIDPFRSRRTAERVAQAVGAKLLVLSIMPGANPQAADFFSWFDANVAQISAALKP